MGDHLETVRVGVVQAVPSFLDREGSIRKAVRLIEEAADLGVKVVVFPEGFIPAHPVWFHFHSATSRASRQMATELFRNAVVVGGASTDELAEAARRTGVWTVMGICEKRRNTTGTLWNSVIQFSPEGSIVSVHRKLTPTAGERIVHTGGDSEGLRFPTSSFGTISSLICGENSNPLLVFSTIAQYPVIHAALWPNHFSPHSPRMRDVILNASRAVAYQGGCYVLNSAAVLDPETIERIARDQADRDWLSDPDNVGGSCIVAPNGEVLAGPVSGSEETILVADLDLDQLFGSRAVHDHAGHYSRPDVFSVIVHPPTKPLFQAFWLEHSGVEIGPDAVPEPPFAEAADVMPHRSSGHTNQGFEITGL